MTRERQTQRDKDPLYKSKRGDEFLSSGALSAKGRLGRPKTSTYTHTILLAHTVPRCMCKGLFVAALQNKLGGLFTLV